MACVPSLPSDIITRRAFTPVGRASPAVNSTLWWSVSLQRSRLDIFDGTLHTTRSTLTDPAGTGMAYSAEIASDKSCTCTRFPFSNALQEYTYIGTNIANCTRRADTFVNGIPVRHWSVDALQPYADHFEYFAEMSAPWPVQIISKTGRQDFAGFTQVVPPLAAFKPQPCCASTITPPRTAAALSQAKAERWEQVASMPTGRLNHCLAAADAILYVAGGYNFPPPDYFASALSYNPKSDKWSSELPSMTTNRDAFGCGIVDGVLYAVGGESGNYPFTTKSVERLNLTGTHRGHASWELVASMHEARQGHSVTVLDGVLYAAGGMALDATATILASMEAFDAKSNHWTKLAPMANNRCYFGLIGSGGTLYAFGGFSGGYAHKTVLAAVEAFDVRTGRWRQLSPLPEARERMAVAATSRGLYILGGCPARQGTQDPCDTLLKSVWCFTPPPAANSSQLGNWTAAPDLPAPNAWLAAATLDGDVYAVGGGLSYGRNATYRLRGVGHDDY